MRKSCFTLSKDIDKFLRTLSSDFQLLPAKSKHASLLHLPSNTRIPIPKTPSCRHAVANFKSQVRRLTSQIPSPKS